MTSDFGAGQQPYSLVSPRKLTPTASVLVMMAIWAAVYAVAPVELYAPPTVYPYLLLGLSFVGLLLGFSLFEPRRLPSLSADQHALRRSLSRLYEVTFALGLIGIGFRVIDWVVYRGFSIGLDFAENTEKAAEGGGNPFSTVAVFLIPFTVAPYIFHAVAKRNGHRVGRAWMASGLAILWPILSLLIGSRSTIFMQIGMLVIARVIVVPRFPRRTFVSILVLFVLLVHIAGYIFLHRIEEIGLDLDKVSRISVFTHLVPTTSEYYYSLTNLSDPWRQIYFIDVVMFQYFMHGVPEFGHLVEHYAKGDQWGLFTFRSVVRIYSILANKPFSDEAIALLTPRAGVYTTFFGPLYVDYGPLTPIAGFIIGAFVSWVRRCVLYGSIAALPLYVVLTMQMIAAVIVGTINGAYGIFYDMAFAGLWVGCIALRPARGRPSHGMAMPDPAESAARRGA